MDSSDESSALNHLGLSSNALIDALMGSGIPLPRRQHPEAEVEALLESIDSCTDVETLVAGIKTDLKSVLEDADLTKHNSDQKEGEDGPTKHQQTSPPIATISARLTRIKSLLYKERTMNSNAFAFFKNSQFKTFASALLHSILLNDEREALIPQLLENLEILPFESRKDVASIFNYLLVCGCAVNGVVGTEQNDSAIESYTKTMLGFVFYVNAHFSLILNPIVKGHFVSSLENSHKDPKEKSDTDITESVRNVQMFKPMDVALHCGSMFRSILRHPLLYNQLVSEDNIFPFVYPFLDVFANQANFEVSSDALETLRLIMHPGSSNIAIPTVSLESKHDTIVSIPKIESAMEAIEANFLDRDFDNIFTRFNNNLLTEKHANYVTRRISLQLLSSILLSRSNYKVMIKYISVRSNLRTIMILLSDPSAHIQMEAFNVFKIFVANPTKPNDIIKILVDNKIKLIKYLTSLHQEKEATDSQFREEKVLVISTLENLEMTTE
jgi:hypothetical protein